MNILSLTHPQQRLSAHGGAVDARRQQLEAAAEQFEAMFLQQILKQMRKAGDVLSADNPMRSRDLDTLRDFYDETLADSLATRRQTGISDLLVQQLAGDQDASNQAQRLAAMDQQPLPRSTAIASNFQPLADTWRRGVGQLERVWERGSVAFQRLVDSVVKHESGGRVDAVSPVGALGLMQLMPDTAREMAGELGVPYNQARLLQDGDYNKLLGSAYLNKMLERYSGSEVLALAAYNAGPGRVDQWLQRFGDPRQPSVSEAEWVERIPFAETRNYTRNILRDIRQSTAQESLPPSLRPSLSRVGSESASETFKPQPATVALDDQGQRSTGELALRSPAFAPTIRPATKEPAA